MIALKDISVAFDGLKAVDHVNLTIEDGDIFGIVGYSGAGKSTLVRTINLLQRPTTGEVWIGEENLLKLSDKELRSRRKKIGMIFQNFNLLKSRTILENVIYPIRRLPLSKEEKEQKARKLLELVGIADKEKQYPAQLSGGQQQRCAIARALASDPEILLCDEATSALDPKTTDQILDLLKTVNEKLGLTIVIITHQMDVVKRICNKCAVMQKGKVVEWGNTIDLFSQPNEHATREFVHTASGIAKSVELLESGEITIPKGEEVAELRYVGDATTEPLISELLLRFQVKTNILAGSVERITGIPVGNLIVSFDGAEENIQKAISFLKENRTQVRRIGGQDGIL